MDALPVSELHVRDWSELPLPALTSLFRKLRAVDVLMGAGLVCQSWLEAAKSPCLWHEVDMSHKLCYEVLVEKCAMAKVAIDRSSGQLEAFVGEGFVTDDLLKYIGERSPSLKCLRLISCVDVSDEGFSELLTRSPLLEDLTVMGCDNIEGACLVAATACPRLKRLVLYKRSSSHSSQIQAPSTSTSTGEWIWITCRTYVKSKGALGIAKGAYTRRERHHRQGTGGRHRRLSSPGASLFARLLEPRGRCCPASKVCQDQDAGTLLP